jgi:DNA polymerase III sliding clamp (beta) subunit (PCNA family)
MKIHRDLLLGGCSAPSTAVHHGADSLASHLLFDIPGGMDGQILIRGHDGTTSAWQWITPPNDTLQEAFCTRAKPLMDLLNAMPSADIDINVEYPHVIIKSGRSTYKLPAQDGRNFPAFDPTQKVGVAISSSELRSAMAACGSALTGSGAVIDFNQCEAFIQRENEPLRLAGASKGGGSLYEFSSFGTEDRGVLLHKRTIAKLTGALPADCEVVCSLLDSTAVFTWGAAGFIAPLVDLNLPDYLKVLGPSGPDDNRITMNRDEFISALKRISSVVVSDSESPTCAKLEIANDSLLISSVEGDAAQAQEIINIEGAGKLNSQYDLSLLSGALRYTAGEFLHCHLPSNGAIKIVGSSSPQLIYTQVYMRS